MTLLIFLKLREPFQKVDVWQGKVDKIDVYTEQDIYKTIKKAKKKVIKSICQI